MTTLKANFSKLRGWANSRKNYFHLKLDITITHLLLFAICSILLLGVYNNLDKLNQIYIWIVPFGTIVILTLSYYWIKFFFKLVDSLHLHYLNQRNWIRYTILILIALASWQLLSTHGFVDMAVKSYTQINFTKILSIQLNGSKITTSQGQNIDLSKLFPAENITKKIEYIANKTRAAEDVIFQETNAQRMANGLLPLKLEENLSKVAREHSEDMATNNFFAHINLIGEDPTARAVRHGIYGGIAENIGKMPTGWVAGVGYVDDTPEDVGKAQVQSWMGSPGHRANILNPRYTTIGVGVAYDGSLYYISTQNFK